MAPVAFSAWLERSRKGYTQDLVTAGRSPEDSARQAAETYGRFFPNDSPSPLHAVFGIVDASDATVGHLWIGPDAGDDDGASIKMLKHLG